MVSISSPTLCTLQSAGTRWSLVPKERHREPFTGGQTPLSRLHLLRSVAAAKIKNNYSHLEVHPSSTQTRLCQVAETVWTLQNQDVSDDDLKEGNKMH